MKEDNTLRILLVEDDPVSHQAIVRVLTRSHYVCIGVDNLKDARRLVREQNFHLIVCDVMLPDGSGFDFVEDVRSYLFDMPIVIITASEKKGLIEEALQRGADDFISKPFLLQNLTTVVERNLERKRLQDLQQGPRKAAVLLKAIQALITALEAKDSYTSGHSMRVARHARMMTEAMGLPEEDQFTMELAAILHDIGKIGMPDSILKKSSSLLEMEYRTAKEHTIIGSKIVGKIDELKEVAAIIRHHHERFDGKGYPDGLAGDVIPLFARVLAIVDAFESIVSHRVYSKPKTNEEALTEIEKHAGTQFDPYLVKIFAEVIRSRVETDQPRLKIEEASLPGPH